MGQQSISPILSQVHCIQDCAIYVGTWPQQAPCSSHSYSHLPETPDWSPSTPHTNSKQDHQNPMVAIFFTTTCCGWPQACWHVVICHVNAAPAICYNSDSTWVQIRINYARVKGGMCSSLLCPSTLSPSHHLRPTSRCTLSQRVPCSSSSDMQLSTVMPSWRHWTRRD